MSNDGNKFLPIFQIQYIKNEWFLLELDMALVTTIGMRFLQVWVPSPFDFFASRNSQRSKRTDPTFAHFSYVFPILL